MRTLIITGLLALSFAGRAEGADERAERLSRVRDLLAKEGIYAVAEHIQGLGDPGRVATAYEESVLDLYWKAKDVPAAVAVGRAGILFALTRGRELAAKEPDRSKAWLGLAKSLAYNVGSFAWPGWGEAVEIGPAEARAGHDAARLDLRLAIELKRPPDKVSAAHWLVGAHELAAGDDAAAARSFAKAAAMSREAKDAEGAAMSAGYVALTALLAETGGGPGGIEAAVAPLEKIGSDDAKFYADQLRKALPALRAWRSRKEAR